MCSSTFLTSSHGVNFHLGRRNVEQCLILRIVWGTKDAILGTMRNDNEASYHRIMGEEAARDNETKQTNYRLNYANHQGGHHACLGNFATKHS